MSERPLHIAWIGFAPAEEVGGVPGIATDLLGGLARLGHSIDCFFPAGGRALPAPIADIANVAYVPGRSSWQWGRWYSRTRATAFVSSLLSRLFASWRLRGEVLRRHRQQPYDVFYQFSNVENLSVPRRLRHRVPLVVHPGQSSADALRFFLRERQISLQGRPTYKFALAALSLWARARIQRRQVRRAALVVCISDVFRAHQMRDYGLTAERSVVVANPIRVERFQSGSRPLGRPPTVIVLGRIATGKGLEDVVALARLMLARGVDVRFRLVGGTSVWSDYTGLLASLPAANAEYAGRVKAAQVPGELARSDILLQASKYEAFALTVAEALASGVPVVATTEVGAIERVDRSVALPVAPGDVEAMAAAIVDLLGRLGREPAELRARARAEAERLFAGSVVCADVAAALQRLVAGQPQQGAAEHEASDSDVAGLSQPTG